MYLFIIFLILTLYCLVFGKSTEFGEFTISKQWTYSIKGILALMILAHHIGTHLLPQFPAESIWTADYLFWNHFFSFGSTIVGIFFFISGYGLLASFKSKGESYLKSFFSKRFSKILIPVAIVVVIEQLFYLAVIPNHSILESVKGFYPQGTDLFSGSYISLSFFT